MSTLGSSLPPTRYLIRAWTWTHKMYLLLLTPFAFIITYIELLYLHLAGQNNHKNSRPLRGKNEAHCFIFSLADFCPAAQSEDRPRGSVCGRTWQQECVQVWAGHCGAEVWVWLYLRHLFALPYCWGCYSGKSYLVERGESLLRLCGCNSYNTNILGCNFKL